MNVLSKINDQDTLITTSAERAFLKTLEGGCQIPVGSHSHIEGNTFYITGFISSIDGSLFLKDSASAPVDKAIEVSVNLAQQLYDKGGKEILETIRNINLTQTNEIMPLTNKVIVSTRALEAGDSLPELLQAKGAKLLSLPMIEIAPVKLTPHVSDLLQNLEMFDWVFFSSKNGVSNFFRMMVEAKGNTNLPKSIKKAVIGKRTAAELEYYGYAADYISPGNTSEDLLDLFYKSFNSKNQRILLSLGNLADDTLINRLSKDNDVKRINVYETIKPTSADKDILNLIKEDKYDLIVFTSPSTFDNFSSFYGKEGLKTLRIASIGKTTSKAIEDAGVEPLITAKKSSTIGLAEAINDYFNSI